MKNDQIVQVFDGSASLNRWHVGDRFDFVITSMHDPKLSVAFIFRGTSQARDLLANLRRSRTTSQNRLCCEVVSDPGSMVLHLVAYDTACPDIKVIAQVDRAETLDRIEQCIADYEALPSLSEIMYAIRRQLDTTYTVPRAGAMSLTKFVYDADALSVHIRLHASSETGYADRESSISLSDLGTIQFHEWFDAQMALVEADLFEREQKFSSLFGGRHA